MGEKGSYAGHNKDNVPTEKLKKNKFVYGCVVLASMTSILLGYDIGVMSGAAMYIQTDLKISDLQLEILIGILNLYSLIGSGLAGKTSDMIGRRYTIVFAAVIFFVGALLMGFATNYAFLMVGRFVAGIGVGYGMMIAPVYTTEVAPASARGFLTSLPEVFINIGILLGYVSNLAFSHLNDNINWRLMLGIGAVPSVFLGIGVLAMPESPRWLMMQGRLGDARKVLLQTSDSKEDAEFRLDDIKAACGISHHDNSDIVQVPKQSHGQGVWRELILVPTPAIRRVVIAAVGIHFFQQASGIDAVVLYSPRIFKKAGITKKSRLLAATVAVGFVKTVFILVATFLVDRLGRRPLLLSSVGGMIVSLAGLATGLTVVEVNDDKKIMWAIVLCCLMILTFVAFFSIGIGPVTWVYSAEVFPLRLRAQGCSMGVGVNRVMSGVISMTFLSLTKAITIGGAFFLFTGFAIIAWLFIYFFLPETQGKNLEDIGELFGVETKKYDSGSGSSKGKKVQLAER
ncbi:hypothetical protein GIB67_017490 [Kingdonia uniflora]|uniref:Major facilitator superfamily (MFS) profile domain-containing protein n=1 Tax=Kingdonia uniflora TaxID=39325 RepID=A0A7J7M4F7_9MAGN|nr:hypothetical protein GIB67_017490 [Kingdonia uniflora]